MFLSHQCSAGIEIFSIKPDWIKLPKIDFLEQVKRLADNKHGDFA
jgi:hypothetical protein